MKVYTTDKDGYIIGIKNVGDKYTLTSNDFNGDAPHPLNHHYKTGIERPLTQEQKDQQEIQELNAWLDLRRNIEHPEKAEKQARLTELLV